MKKNTRCSLTLLFLSVCVPALAQFPEPPSFPYHPPVAMNPMPPVSAYEPPAAANVVSLRESTAASQRDLLTTAERTNYEQTGSYQESLDLARKLEKASPSVRVVTLGKTPQGREFVAVIVSKDRAFTPEAARRTGKPVILIQNGIHAGENGGKDAAFMLLRDIVVAKRYPKWLDSMIFISIPVFNVDGHERVSAFNRINEQGPREMGFRTTAQRLNLNRDYVKADAPEMRMWLQLYNAWLPDFLIDNHVSDGMDLQYDVTIGMPVNQDLWPTGAQWTKEKYLPLLTAGMEKAGHVFGYYASLDLNRPDTGIRLGAASPRYSTGYAAIQNRPALLVETHSLKTFRTRTWSHYDIMRESFDAIAADPKALRAAVQQADEAVARLAGDPKSEPVFLSGQITDVSQPFTFRAMKPRMKNSTVTGAPIVQYTNEKFDVATEIYSDVRTTVSAAVPPGYYVPAEWTSIIDLLKLHGVRTERINAPVTKEFDTWRFTDVSWARRPFEGRFTATYKSVPAREKRTISAGSIYVPMNQRAARVALNLLEPDAPDSLLRWGFLNTIFELKEYFSGYIMEPIAEKMLADNPALRAEFEEKLKDKEFASSPSRRLAFLHSRSPYYEQDKDAYPIVREISASR